VQFNDANNNGAVAEDVGQAEEITYDIGDGPVTSQLDSTVAYSITITYGPASGLPPVTVVAGVLQDEEGNMFLLGPQGASASTAALGAAPIQSIVINGVAKADYSGVTVPRFPTDFLCFARGTLIATEAGEVPVELLRVGQRVQTLDNGLQPLRMIAWRRVAAEDRMAPVAIAPGVLGNRRELVLSPQHRVLVAAPAAELIFAEPEVLVPAVGLVDGQRAVRRPGGTVDYFHLVCDRHEVLFAEGAPAESLYVGEGSLEKMGPELCDEVMALFPDFESWSPGRKALARPCLTVRETGVLSASAPTLARADWHV
jgi:hypothetical protein